MKFKDLLLKIIADLHFRRGAVCGLLSSTENTQTACTIKTPNYIEDYQMNACVVINIPLKASLLSCACRWRFSSNWFHTRSCPHAFVSLIRYEEQSCQVNQMPVVNWKFISLRIIFNWSVERKVISALVKFNRSSDGMEWNALKQSG